MYKKNMKTFENFNADIKTPDITKSFIEIAGKNLSEKINNGKKEGLNIFVRPVNSDEDHYYFFENEDTAENYISKFDEEEVEVWDLNDQQALDVLLED